MNEKVLCVPRKAVEDYHNIDGLMYCDGIHDDVMLEAKLLSRDFAEHDETHKQIIPYVILSYGHGAEDVNEDNILYYIRDRRGGESRLHSAYSIGFGGHINDSEPVATAAAREVWEELKTPLTFLQPVAVLNDDSTEVGRVHIGVVFIAKPQYSMIHFTPSQEVILLGYTTANMLQGLVEDGHDVESWSVICIQHLTKLINKAKNVSSL